MSQTLTSHQAFYASLSAEITANICKIDNLARDADIDQMDQAKAAFAQIKKNFEDAEELFEQMELEIRSLSPPDRTKFHTQLQSYIAELARLKKAYLSCRKRFSQKSDRSQLLGEEVADGGDVGDLVSSAKDRLLQNTETLERSSRKLELGQNLLNETESIGAAVLGDLAQQKEVLIRSRNRLRETDDDLGIGSKILSRMISRAQSSKVLLVLLFLVIIVVVIVGIYFSFHG